MSNVTVKSIRDDPEYGKCSRCRRYEHSCSYDAQRGVPVELVLCNRCMEVVKKAFGHLAIVHDMQAAYRKAYPAKDEANA